MFADFEQILEISPVKGLSRDFAANNERSKVFEIAVQRNLAPTRMTGRPLG
jgi:hypothetical protein